MKAVLFEHDKSESVKEIDPLAQNKTRNLRLVQDCSKIIDGERLPIYIRRVYEAADSHLASVVLKIYGQK